MNSSTVPNREPDLRRKFQFTNLDNNNNKYWLIELWQAEEVARSTYGRVRDIGEGATAVWNGVTPRFVDNKIREKLDKGYQELDLHKPEIQAAENEPAVEVLDPITDDFVRFIFNEANENIKSYLAVGVDQLSTAQIAKGLQILQRLIQVRDQGIRGVIARDAAEEYFRTIPTQLPPRIDSDQVVRDLLNHLDEQDQRLQQLAAAVATRTAQKERAATQIQSLGAMLKPMDSLGKTYRDLMDYIEQTTDKQTVRRVKSILSVRIPDERYRWDNDSVGKDAIVSLMHGTGAWNLRHILNTGLIIPSTAANGSRLGRAIYFADYFRRSLSYARSRHQQRQVILVADVALGNPKIEPGSLPASTRQPPAGYDSVWGTNSWSGMDEFVVYRREQQTVMAVVVFE